MSLTLTRICSDLRAGMACFTQTLQITEFKSFYFIHYRPYSRWVSDLKQPQSMTASVLVHLEAVI